MQIIVNNGITKLLADEGKKITNIEELKKLIK